MSDTMPKTISLEEFNAAPDTAEVSQPVQPSVIQSKMPKTLTLEEFDSLPSDEEKYGTVVEQAKTLGEGIGEGLAGPLFTGAQKALGVKPEDIQGRRAENPIAHGVGEVAGFTTGLLTGTGEAAVMGKAGQVAQKALGLTEATTTAAKVGSAAVREAVEMAVMQSGDEVSKMILQDPHQTAQSAIADIGLAAALGGGGGAFMTGVANPLWKATAGPKVEEFLGAVKGHLDGTGKLVLPEAVDKAAMDLGLNIDPAMKAALSGDTKAIQMFNELREAQHPEIIKSLQDLKANTSKAVADGLGTSLDDIAYYSQADAGHELLDAFTKEYSAKYEPIAKAMEARNKLAETIDVADEFRRDFGGKIMESGMNKVGTDSPYFKMYEQYAQRVMAKDTIGGLDKLKTEIMNKANSMTSDINEKNALRDIRSMIADFQESMIEKSAKNLLVKDGEKIGEDILAERAAQNLQYAEFRKLSENLAEFAGVGRISGAGGLKDKITSLTPEELVRKFSPKGDVDAIPFMREHFPETFKAVQANEMKKFLSPSVFTDKGESVLDVNKLSKAVEKTLKGSPEYLDFVLPKDAVSRIQAAKTLADAVPGIKSSGTAGWMTKMYKHLPASAIGALGFMMGHNPISSLLIGNAVQALSKNVPEAAKLGLLKFMASEQPIKAEAFGAMVDFLNHTIKGENKLTKAITGVFKPTTTEIINYPDVKTTDKIDKKVEAYIKNPEATAVALGEGQTGHYLPEHQMALSETGIRVMDYLSKLKPHPYKAGPLDRPIEPSPEQKARYTRALAIAQEPYVVMNHIKNGTVQLSDIADINGMYPALYPKIVQKLTNEMIKASDDVELIPYKTKMGLSLFMGQAVDSSMNPASIIAAQPIPQQQPQAPNQGKSKQKGSTSKLGKNVNSYRTASQDAEYDRGDRG